MIRTAILKSYLPPMLRTSGFLGSGLRWPGGILEFCICHFSKHCGSWMEMDLEPNSRPQM